MHSGPECTIRPSCPRSGPHSSPWTTSPCPTEAVAGPGSNSPQPCPAHSQPGPHMGPRPGLAYNPCSREVPSTRGWGCPSALLLAGALGGALPAGPCPDFHIPSAWPQGTAGPLLCPGIQFYLQFLISGLNTELGTTCHMSSQRRVTCDNCLGICKSQPQCYLLN